MNKKELIRSIAEKSDLSESAAKRALAAFIDTVQDHLRDGGQVVMVGFGSFELKQRSGRVGRNPKTGEKITIPATKAPAFKPGKGFKEAVNSD